MPRLSDGFTGEVLIIDPDLPASFRSRLERLQARDMSALGEVFTEYGDICFRIALRLTRSRADAEDITQDLFVRLPVVAQGFAGSAKTFPGWIRRVAVRQALMHMRGGADSGMRLISASDECSAREYRAGRVMAGAYLALGHTASAERAFVAAATPQIRGEWTDSVRLALGSRFNQARWDAALDSSAHVTKRCSETRSLEWQARRTIMK